MPMVLCIPAVGSRRIRKAGPPSIRTKALSRHTFSEQWFEHRVVAREGGGPRLWKSHGESFLGGTNRSTNHRYGQNGDHDSSMRIPISIGTRAPNQFFGLALADQGHPRAALDLNDLRIPLLRAQHPVESYGQLPCRCHLGYTLGFLGAAVQVFLPHLRSSLSR